ncbi:nuclease-related domain-containing protein [Carnobacterium mobile]|uniref:nuclease-related domain-containing protein n=1 Tax=Carnobacterium mobile TaxID=2750 RepID=UPI00068E2E5E|nr:nuclease-related domain-containing protein [Carnobacterium mobile]
MEYKREKPVSLKIMESLAKRGELTPKERQYLQQLQKGFAGERVFDQMSTQLSKNCLIMNDLLLRPDASNAFQIDSLILTNKAIYLYEIKNYSGEYCYGEEMLLKLPNFKVSNPLIQVQTTKNKLILFLKELQYDIDVKAYVTYVNPEFTLFNAPRRENILLPTQLNKHFTTLENQSIPLTAFHKKIAADFAAHQIEPTPFKNDIPNYSFSDLRKGICCEKCNSFHLELQRIKYHCCSCMYERSINSALLASIKEYQLLFPDNNLNTEMLFRWCNKAVTKKRIRRVLNTLL